MTSTQSPIQIPEEDALAYTHMQSLAKIQAEIHQLRAAIPIFLTPLLDRPQEDLKGPEAADKAEDFRVKATKIQGDVKALVAHLEEMCTTLEAAEKIRTDDDDGRATTATTTASAQTNGLREVKLERVGVAREFTEDDGQSNVPVGSATPQSPRKLEDPEVANGLVAFDSNDIAFDDFGLGSYSDMDWSNMGLPDDSLNTGFTPT